MGFVVRWKVEPQLDRIEGGVGEYIEQVKGGP